MQAQTITTEIHAEGKLISERQERAILLTRQIIANGNIAANSMLEMGRDLKIVRDERLFSEMGFESFEDYCEKQIGIGKRHGYNFIQVFERFGEERLAQLQGLGITKLLEIAKLDDEDANDLLRKNDVNALSVRELSAKVEEYRNKYEQLTLLLEEEKSKNAQEGSLEAEIEELKKLLETAQREKETLREQFHQSEKRNEVKSNALVKAAQRYDDERKEYQKRINELENRPVEVAVQEPTAEQMEQIREHVREEERQAQETVRITAVDAARKQEAAKYAAEIEKLKAENAILQSNAHPAPAPCGGYKEQIKFLLAEISRAFDSALNITNSIEDSEERAKYRGALGRALKQLEDTIC